ncbi:hypothetical protein NT6N_05860 [Oceaniferula spumae]|uniref:Uncharacterized protein n=1 Tax=Oceaniferula spumae TaxID=2979115 RepID=A0AAT9FHV3_9BACT
MKSWDCLSRPTIGTSAANLRFLTHVLLKNNTLQPLRTGGCFLLIGLIKKSPD